MTAPPLFNLFGIGTAVRVFAFGPLPKGSLVESVVIWTDGGKTQDPGLTFRISLADRPPTSLADAAQFEAASDTWLVRSGATQSADWQSLTLPLFRRVLSKPYVLVELGGTFTAATVAGCHLAWRSPIVDRQGWERQI